MLNMIKLDWHAMKYYQVRVIILPFYLMLMGVFSPYAWFLWQRS